MISQETEKQEIVESLGHWEDDGGQNIGSDYQWLPVCSALNEKFELSVSTKNLPSIYNLVSMVAMRFGLENELFFSSPEVQPRIEFVQPLRLTVQEYNLPLIESGKRSQSDIY